MDAEERIKTLEAKVSALSKTIAEANAEATTAKMLALSLAAVSPHPGAVLAGFKAFVASVEGHTVFSPASDELILLHSRTQQPVFELLTRLLQPPPSAD